MAISSLSLFACNKKTIEHAHDENCNHKHENVDKKTTSHVHDENCSHSHEHSSQESFTVESEVK